MDRKEDPDLSSATKKSDKYWIDLESLKLKGPQVEIIFTSG